MGKGASHVEQVGARQLSIFCISIKDSSLSFLHGTCLMTTWSLDKVNKMLQVNAQHMRDIPCHSFGILGELTVTTQQPPIIAKHRFWRRCCASNRVRTSCKFSLSLPGASVFLPMYASKELLLNLYLPLLFLASHTCNAPPRTASPALMTDSTMYHTGSRHPWT